MFSTKGFANLVPYVEIVHILVVSAQDLSWHTCFFRKSIDEFSIDLVEIFVRIDAACSYVFCLVA